MLLQSKILSQIPNLSHGFGTGEFAFEDYFSTRDISIPQTHQIHSDIVINLAHTAQTEILEGDAFITDQPGSLCYIRTADCVPILIADKKRMAIAAVHAGWKGTHQNIVSKTLIAMKESFGTNAGDCMAAIGPAICSSCYEVGDEVIDALSQLPIAIDEHLTGMNIDLSGINASLLEKAGVNKENIEQLGLCTKCDERFNSYRKNRTAGRQISFIIKTEERI
ncbi:MAG: peptidoglycan editing factor PgeF [Pseudomonadota bacterium]